MVVDDHPRTGKKDRTRAREAAVLRELKEAGLDVHPDVRVFASVSSELPTDQDHNYGAYVDQFTRTVLNHASKAEVYRAERPGYDLGFLSSWTSPRPTSKPWVHSGRPERVDLIGGSPIRPSWMR
jgi:hypothetical protein